MTAVEHEATPASAWGLLRLPRTILFGAGQRHAVGRAVREHGERVLVCTDERFAGTAEMDDIRVSLERAGCAVRLFAGTEPELPMAAVERAARSLRGGAHEVVVGVGGGSCIDMAKVVAVLLSHGGSLDDYVGEHRVPGPMPPVVAMPTTAGTGSEATPVAVLADGTTGTKRGISSPHLIPTIAVCDPELIRGCPPGLAAAAGADALAHLVESFTAIRRPASSSLAFERVFVGQGELTSGVALAGVHRLARSLGAFHRGSDRPDVRDDVMFGALAGGIALGTAGTAAAHALQYPIGSLTQTSHGLGVGTLLPYVMRFNRPAREPEFAAIGAAIGVDPTGDARTDAMAAIERIDALLADIGIPGDLATLGVRTADLDDIASRALDSARLVANNPRPLDHAALLDIARRAHAGDRTHEP